VYTVQFCLVKYCRKYDLALMLMAYVERNPSIYMCILSKDTLRMHAEMKSCVFCHGY